MPRIGSFLIVIALICSIVSAGELAPNGPQPVATESAQAADSIQRSTLALKQDGAVTRIEISLPGADGQPQVRELRRTRAAVSAQISGADPAGRAIFAAWDETEAGNRTRWFSYSRDAGDSWIEARPLDTELRLRDGAIAPRQAMPAAPRSFALPSDGGLYIVQFRTIGLPEWRDAIESFGGEVLNYLPHNAHIVRFPAGGLAGVQGLDFVERIEPYEPWYRLAADVRGWVQEDPETATSEPTLRLNVMVFGWGAEAKAPVADEVARLGGRVVENWPNGQILQLELSRGQLQQLVARDDVMWVDRWTPRSDDMDLVREDGGTNFIETNFGRCGQGVRAEVLDSGFQANHPDFDGILFHGSNTESSHGTSTYGIVFGNGARDGDGDAAATGHMPCAEQGIASDYDFLGDRFAHTQELKEAPYFASFQTNSWGNSRTTVYNSITSELDDIIFRLDMAILQSQSNAGNQDSRPQAWGKNVISVGGINHENNLDPADDNWSNSASIGPAEDGRIKPDVNWWYDTIYTTTTGSGYTNFCCTSAATPQTAGITGLMIQMFSENVWGTDPVGATVFERQPRFSTIKALLINNAKQLPFSGLNDDLTRVHQGWGRPSVQIAQERAANSFIIDEEVNLELGDFGRYNLEVPAGETELKITMVYPDPAGTTSASLHRINDVNLQVTSPSGTIYHGNVGLDVGTVSQPGGSPNSVDTVENVFIANPEEGTWEIEITAVEVNQDGDLDTAETDVTFALVATGGTGVLTQPSEGRVNLDQSAYSCAVPVGIRVIDGNVGAPSVNISIWSDTESTPEVLTLTETQPGSGKYAGELMTTTAAPSADGNLSVSQGDQINVEYIDGDDGMGGIDLPRIDLAVTDCYDLVRDSLTLDDTVGGNGDGLLDPGEWIDLPIVLSSVGDGPAENVRVEVESLSPGVEVRQLQALLPDIPAGTSAASAGEQMRIRIRLDQTCTDPVSVRFRYLADGYESIQDDVLPTGTQVNFDVDTFESGTAWQHVAAESSATTGNWTTGDPDGTDFQPEDDVTPDPGTQCLFTAPNAGGLGTDDVDNGVVVARSGSIDLTGHPDVRVSLYRWFANRDLGEDSGDFWRLEVRNGAGQPDVLLEELDFNQSEPRWTEVSFRLADFITLTNDVSLKVSAADGPATGNLVEAAVDEVRFWDPVCNDYDPIPNAVDTLRANRSGSDVVLDWQQPLLDPDHGVTTAYRVYRSELKSSGFSEQQLVPDTGGAAGYTDTGAAVPAPTAYFYLVISENAAGASDTAP